MGQERRAFGSIERRSGYFRARYVGPDRQRYDAPHLFSERIDAEFWLGEVHRSIERQEWRPPVKVKGRPDDLDTLAGYARHCLAERELTPRTREEYGRLLEKLIAPTLGMIQLSTSSRIASGVGTPRCSRRTVRCSASTPTRCCARYCARPRTRA
ncbi:MAG: hypothetical protein U0R27_00395 [Candidatus Nanopelagicales bacterium]